MNEIYICYIYISIYKSDSFLTLVLYLQLNMFMYRKVPSSIFYSYNDEQYMYTFKRSVRQNDILSKKY